MGSQTPCHTGTGFEGAGGVLRGFEGGIMVSAKAFHGSVGPYQLARLLPKDTARCPDTYG
jgi:hypothetical protein